jgi:hypothetical protein
LLAAILPDRPPRIRTSPHQSEHGIFDSGGIYELRSPYAARLSAGGVGDEWVIQMLRQGDSQVFKKYSQMKLQIKREALDKINRRANEMPGVLAQQGSGELDFDTVLTQ